VLRCAQGEAIRSLRRNIGMAQEELALLTGINRSYMGRIERGESSITIATLYRLLPYLRVTFARFAEEFEQWVCRCKEAQLRYGGKG